MFAALTNVSFSLHTGEIVGLLGLNGAGKSTTLSLLTGRLAPDQGEIIINGVDALKDPVISRGHFGFLPEGAPLFEDLSVTAHLKTLAGLCGLKGGLRTSAINTVLNQFELVAVRHQIIDTLSKGFRRRVALAGAFLNQPPVLFLDEPTDGLDPIQKDRVLNQLKAARKIQTLLISTHSLEDVDAICDRVLVLNQGRLVFAGTVEEMKYSGSGGGLKAAFEHFLAQPVEAA